MATENSHDSHDRFVALHSVGAALSVNGKWIHAVEDNGTVTNDRVAFADAEDEWHRALNIVDSEKILLTIIGSALALAGDWKQALGIAEMIPFVGRDGQPNPLPLRPKFTRFEWNALQSGTSR